VPRFIDFDAARAERQRTPVVVRLFGRDWDLHSGLPAKVMLDIVRAQAAGLVDMPDEQAIDLIEAMVPKDVLDAWLDGGLTVDDLMELVPLIQRAYRESGEPEDDAGEAATPSETPSESANAGG
jgi:hypothetical protein